MDDNELARLTAEKVMGWHIATDDGLFGMGDLCWFEPNGDLVYWAVEGQECWQPTRDIAQAWQLLMDESSQFLLIRRLSSRLHPYDFALVQTVRGGCYLSYMTPGGPVDGPEADTPELAIVLAALKSVDETPADWDDDAAPGANVANAVVGERYAAWSRWNSTPRFWGLDDWPGVTAGDGGLNEGRAVTWEGVPWGLAVRDHHDDAEDHA